GLDGPRPMAVSPCLDRRARGWAARARYWLPESPESPHRTGTGLACPHGSHRPGAVCRTGRSRRWAWLYSLGDGSSTSRLLFSLAEPMCESLVVKMAVPGPIRFEHWTDQ